MLNKTFSSIHFPARKLIVSTMFFLIVIILSPLTGCNPTTKSNNEANKLMSDFTSTGSGNADDLLIVDCLIPGKIKRLGTSVTYLSSRTSEKTTALDCRVRGGEYVAFDRSNYETALKVWLYKANEGDIVAQTYAGEIYEKGLGREPDYSLAANWYRKAADQGYARAQINLGHLYEKGLGVEKDPIKALSWYRMASGLENAITLDPGSLGAEANKRIEELSLEIERSKSESESLRKQLEQTRWELEDAQRELKQTKGDAEAERQKLIIEQQQLSKQKELASSAYKNFKDQLEQREIELEQQKREITGINQNIAQLDTKANNLKQTRQQLEEAQLKLKDKESYVETERQKLDAERKNLEEHKKLADSGSERMKSLESQLEQRESDFAHQKQYIAKLQKEISLSNVDSIYLERAKHELVLTQLALEKKKDTLEIKQQELTSVQQEIEDQKKTASSDNTKISNLEAQLKQRESELELQRREITEINQKIAQLDTKANNLEQASQRLKEAQLKLKDKESYVETERQILDAERKKLEEHKKQASADSARMEKLEEQLKQRESDFAHQKQYIAKLQQEITQSNADSIYLKRAKHELVLTQLALEKKRGELKIKQQKLASAKQEIEDQKKATSSDYAKISNLEEQLAQRKALIGNKDNAIVAMGKKIKLLESRTKDYIMQLEDLKELQAAFPGPSIVMLNPPLVATRSIRVLTASSEPDTERVIKGKVIALAGLQSFTINDLDVEVDKDGFFKVPISVMNTNVTVKLFAKDRQEKTTFFEFQLTPGGPGTREKEKNILPPNSFGDYYALVIGNKNYASWPKLETPEMDALEIAELLDTKYGFKTKVLIDATRYELLQALNELRMKLKDTDNLLIYYAGHGHLEEKISRGYWIPVDAAQDSNTRWISTIQIADILSIMSVNHVMIIADSCYSGALTRSSLARLETGMSDKARRHWIKAMMKKRSRTALTSGDLQPVIDRGGGEHSVFAKALLDVLRENDDIIEGQALHKEISARVVYAASAVEVEQIPQYAPIRFAGHEAGEFFFVPSI
ncbi:MAG: hypothetical protein GY941_07230 [Planctomycetes bacterium]|nr:hypothetical protein [Planctomycetota bacterium]